MTRACTALLPVLVLLLAASIAAAQAPGQKYAGRELTEVLRDLRARGLNIVYSSELVRPEMRVRAEPKSTSPRRILDEVLAPHDLRAVPGQRNTLLVVRVRNDGPVATSPPSATGSIRGVVTDKRTGEPLPGVLVNVQNSELTATTSASGEFRIDGVPAEPQFLFFSRVGYGLARPAVNVEPGIDTAVVVALADGVGAFTEEITVTADRFRAAEPAAPSLQMLTNADLQDLRGVLADDPQRAIQSLPGVATGDDFRSEFSVRGSGFRHIGLSVDDIPVGSLVHTARGLDDTGSLSILNGDIIESGTLLSGPYAQRRPGRLGAWLAYDLREGSRNRTQGHVSASGTASSLSLNGPIGDGRRGSWIASARQSYLDWLVRKLDPEGNATFGFRDAAGKLVFDVTSRQHLQVLVLAGEAKVDESEDQPGPNTLATAKSRSALASLTWRSAFNSALLTQRLAFRGSDFRNHGHFDQELAVGRDASLLYLTDIVFDLGRGLSLRSGATADRTRTAQTLRQFSFLAPGSTAPRRIDAIAQSTLTMNVYSSAAWQGKTGAALEAGVGVSNSSVIARSPVSAWGLGAYPLSRGFTFRAGTSLAWQFPDDEQVALRSAAPLRPERAVSLDVALEQRLGASIRWQLTFYSRRENDVLRLDRAEARIEDGTIVRPDPLPLWQNALSGASRGVELMVQRRSAARLSGWVGYSYGRARHENARAGERFWSDFDQRHAVNVYGQYRFTPKTTFSGKLRVGSNFPLQGYFVRIGETLALGDLRNEERLPVYSRLDLRLNHSFTFTRRRLTLFVEVLNVLGRANLGPTDGTVRTNGTLSGFTEKLLPVLPSLGFVFDF